MTASTRAAAAACPFLLFLAPSSLAQTWENCTPLTTLTGATTGEQFGWIGVNVRDVDGDLLPDYMATAPFRGGNKGQVRVFSGATGLKLFGQIGATGEQLGFSGSYAGELTGDANAEFIAGAPAPQGGQPGSAYVWSGATGAQLFALTGEAAGDQFGYAVTHVEDVDGDGTDDLAVGAPFNDATGNNSGRVYIHSGADGTRIRTFEARSSGEQFGGALAGVGDRNADGRGDVLVGAVASNGGTGRAYVVSGLDGSTIWTFDGDATSSNYSQFFLGPCGDVNNDGTEDLYVSDFNNTAKGGGTGRVFVYDGTDGNLLYTITGEGPGDGFGIGRGWAGDVDGNGHDDLVFGHWTNEAGGQAAGRVSVFRGEDGSKLFHWTGDVAQATLGFDAAGLGDLDGDNVTDFLLTAAGHNNSTGIVHVVSGANPTPPTNYCTTSPNSVGAGALLGYRKSTSIAANEFRLRVTDAPPGAFGVLFYGSATAATPFGSGTMCVAGPRFRLGPPQNANANGVVTRIFDFTQPPLSARGGAVAPGVPYYFQYIYRDAFQTQLSDGLEVTFCP